MRQRRPQAWLRIAAATAMAAGVILCSAAAWPAHADMVIRAGDFGVRSPSAPPFPPGIVPPLPPDIVPPLVQGPCCHGGFGHRPPPQFPFFGFGVVAQSYSLPPAVGQPLLAPGSVLPPPPPDFEPRVVTLKPLAVRPGDPAAVVVMRAGESQEVVKFAGTQTE